MQTSLLTCDVKTQQGLRPETAAHYPWPYGGRHIQYKANICSYTFNMSPDTSECVYVRLSVHACRIISQYVVEKFMWLFAMCDLVFDRSEIKFNSYRPTSAIFPFNRWLFGVKTLNDFIFAIHSVHTQLHWSVTTHIVSLSIFKRFSHTLFANELVFCFTISLFLLLLDDVCFIVKTVIECITVSIFVNFEQRPNIKCWLWVGIQHCTERSLWN